jgi:hypothetical protein
VRMRDLFENGAQSPSTVRVASCACADEPISCAFAKSQQKRQTKSPWRSARPAKAHDPAGAAKLRQQKPSVRCFPSQLPQHRPRPLFFRRSCRAIQLFLSFLFAGFPARWRWLGKLQGRPERGRLLPDRIFQQSFRRERKWIRQRKNGEQIDTISLDADPKNRRLRSLDSPQQQKPKPKGNRKPDGNQTNRDKKAGHAALHQQPSGAERVHKKSRGACDHRASFCSGVDFSLGRNRQV